MSPNETPLWYKKLSTLVGSFEKDPTYMANREAQSLGFCSRCKTPIDKDNLEEMSEKQRMEYNIIGRCVNCQEAIKGPSCTEVISEFISITEQVKHQENINEIEDTNRTSNRKKNLENEEDIIDENFL